MATFIEVTTFTKVKTLINLDHVVDICEQKDGKSTIFYDAEGNTRLEVQESYQDIIEKLLTRKL